MLPMVKANTITSKVIKTFIFMVVFVVILFHVTIHSMLCWFDDPMVDCILMMLKNDSSTTTATGTGCRV